MTTKAKQIQVEATPTGYTPTDPSVEGHLAGISTAIASVAGATLQDAYEAGSTVTTSPTEGSITFGGTESFSAAMGTAVSLSAPAITLTSSNVQVVGNLSVTGTTTTVSSANVNVSDRFVNLAYGNTAPGSVSSGIAISQNPLLSTAVAGAGFTVNSVAVADITGFGPNDLIEVAGANNPANNGRYAVDPSFTPGTGPGVIPIKTVALNNAPVLQNALVADATVAGTVTKITIAALQVSNFNDWEVTVGNTSDATSWPWTSLTAAPATPTLTDVLLAGNTTGARNIVVSTSQAVTGVDGAAGSALIVRGGDATSTNGGGLTLRGGNSGTSGNGGTVTLSAGTVDAASTNGAGGTVTITASGGRGTGSPGNVTITAGAKLSGSGAAGAATVTGGDGGSFGNGGLAALIGGNSTFATGQGGHARLRSGSGNVGGQVQMEAGDSSGNSGGQVLITGGQGGISTSAFTGGNITITGGASRSTGTFGPGGTVAVIGGASTAGNNRGGGVLLRGGAGFGTAAGGDVRIETGANGTGSTVQVNLVKATDAFIVQDQTAAPVEQLRIGIAGGVRMLEKPSVPGGAPGATNGTYWVFDNSTLDNRPYFTTGASLGIDLSAYSLIQNNGTAVPVRRVLNILSGATIADDSVNDRTNITIAAGPGVTVQDEGTPLTVRPAINFIGASVSAVDDPANNRINVTVTASGAGFGYDVLVTSLANLPAPSGGVITLAANTVYAFSGNVNLGTNRIVMGSSSAIKGAGMFSTSTITSAVAGNNLITVLVGTGRVEIQDITLKNTSASATFGELSVTTTGTDYYMVRNVRVVTTNGTAMTLSGTGNGVVQDCFFDGGATAISLINGGAHIIKGCTFFQVTTCITAAAAVGALEALSCQFELCGTCITSAMTAGVVKAGMCTFIQCTTGVTASAGAARHIISNEFFQTTSPILPDPNTPANRAAPNNIRSNASSPSVGGVVSMISESSLA